SSLPRSNDLSEDSRLVINVAALAGRAKAARPMDRVKSECFS
ncbi:MAG: hypothetical protein ACI8UZ_000974, partial [Akkermansiaceae bacterium]